MDVGCTFDGEDRTFVNNISYDCDSAGVIYLILCRTCGKIYVGSTITSFRKRLNNHKSSMNRYSKGQREIASERLYCHFLEACHEGIEVMRVKIKRQN